MFELIRKVVKVNTLKLISFAAIFYLACAFIIYYLEPENFQNPFIAFWWVMTTVTTVGFGDYSPVTVPGMIFGMFLYMTGIGLVGIVLGRIVDSFTLHRTLKVEGKLNYKGKDHYVIIGWSNKAKRTMEEIFLNEHESHDIVLIDQMKTAPFEHERFHYICGNPVSSDTLDQANVNKANSVTVFATEHEDEVYVDGKSLIIASAIESYGLEHGHNIYTIVEVVQQSDIKMFEHVNVDEFILSSETFPFLVAKSMLHHGSSQLFMQLLSKKYGDDLWEIKPDPDWRTYRDALYELQSKGANLIAAGTDFSIIRRLDDAIPQHISLYIICDKETYDQVKRT